MGIAKECQGEESFPWKELSKERGTHCSGRCQIARARMQATLHSHKQSQLDAVTVLKKGVCCINTSRSEAFWAMAHQAIARVKHLGASPG